MSLGQLKGLTILITRPKDQAGALAAAVLEKGGNPLIFPTLEIIPKKPPEGWEGLKQRLKSTDIAVFTSANAVRQINADFFSKDSSTQIAAIGVATQAALAERGILCDWIPMKDFRSEGLLELPVFESIQGKKIIILAGEGGRDYLETVLSERGASVEKIALYDRVCPSSDPEILKKFFDIKTPKIILSTSVESLKNFCVMSRGSDELFELPLMVVSQRVASAAAEQGFKKIVVAENASDEAVIRALTDFEREGGGVR